jgi:hypothetical protein
LRIHFKLECKRTIASRLTQKRVAIIVICRKMEEKKFKKEKLGVVTSDNG